MKALSHITDPAAALDELVEFTLARAKPPILPCAKLRDRQLFAFHEACQHRQVPVTLAALPYAKEH